MGSSEPPDYVELQVTSNFSFLRGASHPEELVAEAVKLGHRAIAITDRNTLAGVVRAHKAAAEHDCRLVVGCLTAMARDKPAAPHTATPVRGRGGRRVTG